MFEEYQSPLRSSISHLISHLDGHVQGLEILEHVVRERSSARVPSLSSLETQRLVNLGQNHLLGNPEKLLLAGMKIFQE